MFALYHHRHQEILIWTGPIKKSGSSSYSRSLEGEKGENKKEKKVMKLLIIYVMRSNSRSNEVSQVSKKRKGCKSPWMKAG